MDVTFEDIVENFTNPVQQKPTDSGWSKKSFVNPFKRNLNDIQVNAEKLAEDYASMSPDQKKAFKD